MKNAIASQSGSPAVPLNVFQRLLIQWDGLHPYNAAQVLKIAGPADLAAMTSAWRETLDVLGLGAVHRQGRHFRHRTFNGELEKYPVRILTAGQNWVDFISGELNRPFDDPDEPPFRPFLLDRGDHHYAGLSYQHWVADSVSIRILLREWFLRVHRPELARREALRQPVAGYWPLFGPAAARWSIGQGFLSSLRWSARNKRVGRLTHVRFDDFTSRFSLHEVGNGLIAPLLALARRNRATLNDVFLAVAAEVCDRFVPVRRNASRPDLALGTIVDLRPYSKRDLSDTFGLFLGFTSTVCRRSELGDFSRLLKAVAAQSCSQKRENVPLFSPMRMMAGLAVGRIFSRRKMIEFYRKRIPIAGGISNVNLNRSWAADFHPGPLLDYIRVSPTGPLMPLVFTPTSLGDHLHFGLTHRPSLIPSDRAEQMAEYFSRRLRELAGR